MAGEQGWEIIDCKPAGQELIATVKAHILSQLTKSKPETKQKMFGCRRLLWDEGRDELFLHGWDVRRICYPVMSALTLTRL